MSSIRLPAVSGLFYPSDAATLRNDINAFIDNAELIGPSTPPFDTKALVAPHAGYIYSGVYAAAAYLSVRRPEQISRVVLLGPSHRVPLIGMAMSSSDVFNTPLGDVRLTKEGVDGLSGLRCVVVDDQPHLYEHCLEVQLPFLQIMLNDFEILPVVVGQTSPEDVAALISCVWGGPETLIVVSSDLSHYHSYKQACAIDGQTSNKIVSLDPSLVGEEACGCYALNGLLLEAERRELSARALIVANSGDTAGDKERVVGYGAYAFG